jgi:hypothetical protein
MITQKTSPEARPGTDLGDDRASRRTVIPAARQDGMFRGWGVRF